MARSLVLQRSRPARYPLIALHFSTSNVLTTVQGAEAKPGDGVRAFEGNATLVVDSSDKSECRRMRVAVLR